MLSWLPLLMVPLLSPLPEPPIHLSVKGTVLTAQQGKKVLWKQDLGDPIGHGHAQNKPSLGVGGRVAWAVPCHEAAAFYHCSTLGFDKRTGKKLFEVDGNPMRTAFGEMITNRYRHPAALARTAIEGYRIDLKTGKVTEVRFEIPLREGCGPLDDTSSMSGRTRYRDQYVYGTQEDQCGTFEVRFDWHGKNTQQPVVTALTTRE